MPSRRICRLILAGLIVLLVLGRLWLGAPCAAAAEVSHHQRVAQLIAAIEDPGATSNQRNESATELKEYAMAHPKADYSDAEIDAMARIVGEDRDDTRFWAAAALFQIGARARRAVPTLRAAYDEVFCQTPPPTARRRYGPSTLDTLTSVLAENGVHPPPPDCPPGSPARSGEARPSATSTPP